MQHLKTFFSSTLGRLGGAEAARFTFRDPGRLVDDDLELILADRYPGNPQKGYVPGYVFHMVPAGRNWIVMGRLSLRIGSTEHVEMYAGHIGYSVEPPYRGRRYAARSCRLVFPLALAHGINPVWITCNPENAPSRRTCEILGATLVEVVPVPPSDPLYAPDTRWKCRYRVDL
jgi:tagatose 1,6-diphosphate aldolase